MTKNIKNNALLDVELRPFKHQVGGHRCVLEVGRSVICKPYNDREVWFYQHVPESFKGFIPRYIGETEVTCDLSQQGNYLVASIPRIIAEREVLLDKCLRDHSMDDNSYNTGGQTAGGKQTWNDGQKLENLVAEYKKPCLMDVRVGRRPFDEITCAGRRKVFESRFAGSTSATLGFRMSGSQSFKTNTGTYIVHEKHDGRTMSITRAKKERRQFFHDGYRLRKDVVMKIIEIVQKIQAILETEQTLLFHVVSLLLIYDGYQPRYQGMRHIHGATEQEPGTCTDCPDALTVLIDENENDSAKKRQTIRKSAKMISFVWTFI